MRQWHVNPEIMCDKHLLGEHVEHHMFVGTINKKRKIDGYLSKNLLQPKSLNSRHLELVKEMKNRGFKHNSPLPLFDLSYLDVEAREVVIDRKLSFSDLMDRCVNCNNNLYNA